MHSFLSWSSLPWWSAARTRAPPPPVSAPETALLAAHDACQLGATTEEALHLIDELLAEVDALEASGALNSGQARALRNHLENARRHIEEGRFCAARAQLRAFREQVEDFVEDEILSEAEAEPLIDGATEVLGDEPPVIVEATISAGSGHTCGLTPSGRAFCWGLNNTGQLGDGTTTDRHEPTAVLGDHTFTSITTGGGFTCAIQMDGIASCWGSNGGGALGDGTPENRLVPTPVAGDHIFTEISAGSAFTCAIDVENVAFCWGLNTVGNLGNGTFDEDSHVPTEVSGERLFTSITLGQAHACAIDTDGDAFCWGWNAFGQLGRGDQAGCTVPCRVSTEDRFVVIEAGGTHTCAIRTDGAAYCWGDNWRGQLGDGTTEDRFRPTAVGGGHRFSALSSMAGSAVASHTCAVRDDAAALCWGASDFGQLGDGTTTSRLVPTVVSTGTDATVVTAGTRHTCAIRDEGMAFCWGRNEFGQLGDGTTTDRHEPTPVYYWTELP
jgi:alpha-tubulin suppressor-like RCC1 family protein